ncbi:hypothetical protein OG552_00160 [Streptomyces sp. NBC_01476]|uniref:hypothetical protein n=1 Tax=Streptomyces sp. NBC_01476 TaxID=2903881 RepID=UPI002E379B33|nr:hypothetical protein [Streptomyces sp. NBC_01476]
MSAQPVHQAAGSVAAIPKTIDAIAVALSGAKRMAFYAQVGQTDAADLEGVIERWWTDALLDQVPGREDQVSAALDGRGLVGLGDLAGRLGVPLAAE